LHKYLGSILQRQTIAPTDDPRCYTFSHPDTATNRCVQKLKEKYCPDGVSRVSEQPFRLAMRSFPRRTTTRGIYEHTHFKTSYNYYECDGEASRKQGISIT